MKVFITSGNTWVKIDPVRVMTNVFTGETGLSLANFLSENKCQVLLASSNEYLTQFKANKEVKINHYKYFEELEICIKNAINDFKPDVIIHAAAVSDYKPKNPSPVKIKSKQSEIDLGIWVPTKKLIKAIRNEYHFNKKLIQFKLETVTSDDELIQIAKDSMKENNSNLCVANRFDDLENIILVKDQNNQKMPRKNLPLAILDWINSDT